MDIIIRIPKRLIPGLN